MKFNRSSISKVIGLFLILFVGGIFVLMWVRAGDAMEKAQHACESVKPGEEYNSAVQKLKSSGGKISLNQDEASVRFLGFGAQWWICTVKFSNAHVVSKETSSDD